MTTLESAQAAIAGVLAMKLDSKAQINARAKLALFLGVVVGQRANSVTRLTRSAVLLQTEPLEGGDVLRITVEDLMNAAGVDVDRYFAREGGSS